MLIIINILLLTHYLSVDMDIPPSDEGESCDIQPSEEEKLGRTISPKGESCDIPNEFKFPKTVEIYAWMQYLGRKLSRKEFTIIHGVIQERDFNGRMKELYEICEKKRLYIPELSNLKGDCLFESLNYHGIGNDVEDLRNSLATIMYLYKDHKNFFPSQETTLQELFNAMNDIKYVVKRDYENGPKFYKYSYNIMCQDVATCQSWDLLPTQLILMVISLIYKIEVCVINNSSEWVNTINVFEECDQDLKKGVLRVYVGHLSESHYLPVDTLDDDEVIDPIYYNVARNRFIRWGRAIEKKIYSLFLMQQNASSNMLDAQNTPPNNDMPNEYHAQHNRTNMFHDLGDDQLDHSCNVHFND